MPSEYSHNTVLIPHLFGGEVGVCSRAVPVLHRLGVEGHDDAVLLRQAVQDVARHPQVVAGGHAQRRAHLELPLRGHHLGVRASDRDTRE